jgi:hypothetical protein
MLDPWSQSDPDRNRQFRRVWTESIGPPKRIRRPGAGGGEHRQRSNKEAPQLSDTSGSVRAHFRAAAEKLFAR